jgi:regulator of protease activity HflC (stomatin/prohibitin superfamily)
MADITRAPFLRHLRGTPTSYVIHLRGGRTVHTGTGRSFWFRPLTAAISEVPVDDRELPLLFHARTADFQDVTVQATVGYRFTDPELAARRLDFGIDPDRGSWRSAPLDQVAVLLTELAQQYAIDLLAGLTLTEALSTGMTAIRARVGEGLAADPRLGETGIGVTGVRVVAVRPEPDLERALQTPAREQVQQEADRATYERRALAVERERAISENELQSQIELATRQQHLVAQQGANTRRQAEEAAAAGRITAEAAAEQDRTRQAAQAEGVRAMGAARAEADAARLAAHAGADPHVLLALTLQEFAGELPSIGTLTLTPDLIGTALARLTAGPGEQSGGRR